MLCFTVAVTAADPYDCAGHRPASVIFEGVPGMPVESAQLEPKHQSWAPERPCRTIVCGTGGVGAAVLREALRFPWLEVVGVQVYTDDKAGVDAGTPCRAARYGRHDDHRC